MNKKQIDFELIWRKLNDTLSSEEELIFKAWLSSNKDHRAYFNKAKNYYETGELMNERKLDLKEIWSEFESRLKLQKRTISYSWPKIAAAASFIILCVVSAYMFFNIKSSEIPLSERLNMKIPPGTEVAKLTLEDGHTIELERKEDFVAKIHNTEIKNVESRLIYTPKTTDLKEKFIERTHTLEIERGHKYDLVLEDGTRVWLNSETKLTFPVEFNPVGDRIVKVEGEAIFKVAKDKKRPFKVMVGSQIIEVLGTEFNIRAYKDEASVYTTLIEGKVKASNTINSNVIEMEPGHQLTYFVETGDTYNKKVNVEQYISWRDGLYIFRDKRLDEIMKTLSRWYNVDFEFDKEGYREIKFTGEFSRDRNLEEILEILEHTNEVKFKSDYEGIVIY